MRIEQISTTKNIHERSYEKALAQGDILIAQVTAVMEDAVALKSQGGAALTARLLGSIGVAVGDFVETVVDEADGGLYVLRIIDISRGPVNNDTRENTQGSSTTAAAQTLWDTLSMLKMNPGAEPKSALFLARHGIPAQGNIETMNQLAKGAEPIGKLMSEAMSLIRATVQTADTNSSGVAMQPATQEKTQTSAPAGQPEAALSIQAENASAASRLADTAAEIKAAAQSAAAPNIQTDAAAADAAHPISSAVQNAPQAARPSGSIEAPKPDIPAEKRTATDMQKAGSAITTEAKTAIQNTYDGKARGRMDLGSSKNGLAKGAVPQGIKDLFLQKAAPLFIRLADREALALRIRKAMKALPEELKELKLLLDRNDTKNKDIAVQKLESAEKQISLLAQVKRFECFRIPLLLHGNRAATAELYVYRYMNKKASQDGQNTVILLGLDTEHMGRVETLLKASGKSLDIKLHLEDMRLSGEISNDVQQFKETAADLGYSQINLNIVKLAARTTLLGAEEKLTAYADGGAGNVDIRI